MNERQPHDLPVGPPLGDWSSPPELTGERLVGRTVTLEPQVPERDSVRLHPKFVGADHLWTYLPWGPFETAAEMQVAFESVVERPDWRCYTLIVDDDAVGVASYLRLDPRGGVAEIGGITWAPTLQRSTASTEAIALMISHAFDQGYRRVEWKCDDLNAASRAAAERFGFTYEGTFRKATHYLSLIHI